MPSSYPLDIFAFASPRYWGEESKLNRLLEVIKRSFSAIIEGEDGENLRFHLIHSDDEMEAACSQSGAKHAVFLPLSGGVQNWMIRLSENFKSIALLNAYLPEIGLPEETAGALLSANAHPASTDFYAHLRMRHRKVFWIGSEVEWRCYSKAFRSVQRLNHSRILQIGPTEPWVVNSCREPERFKEALGVEILPLALEELYDIVAEAPQSETARCARSWIEGGSGNKSIDTQTVTKACAVLYGLEKLLEEYEAEGLALACFDLIPRLGTTGCLALSALNRSERYIAACEGDVDAAVTMSLVKALGGNLLWMGNPIIHNGDYLDLVHCTAPCGAGPRKLDYSFKPHHETGAGISLQVSLPLKEIVTLVRIGNDLNDICICPGETVSSPRLPTCHTQIRVNIPSSKRLRENLLGNHLVCAFADIAEELKYCAGLLNLRTRTVE